MGVSDFGSQPKISLHLDMSPRAVKARTIASIASVNMISVRDPLSKLFSIVLVKILNIQQRVVHKQCG